MAEDLDRLFVGVPVPAGALADCAALLDQVRAGHGGRGIRWVSTENLHLTLRFLGLLPPSRIEAMAGAVDAAAVGRSSFPVELAGAGAFPGSRRPRAIWLGMERGAEELGGILRALDTALVQTGMAADDRPFLPHLTVARTDAAGTAGSLAVAAALREAAEGWRTTFTADRVVLYRSHLGGGPPRYEPVHEARLVG
ncbi:MAG: RNA 2',3'-cyclic phosphodiesterase [Candidatus Limnocylindrales bacterium]